MARIRHVAIVVSDQERAAGFYKNAIGLSEAGREYTEHGSGVYVCDGEMNLALLNYKSDAMAGVEGSAKLVGATETDTGYSVPERPEFGVLRRDFPHWVREGNLAGIVIDCQQAHVSHGGRGAFYVYLKKRRSGD